MQNMIKKGDNLVEGSFVEFIETKILPNSGITKDTFWQGLSDLIQEFDGEMKDHVQERVRLQLKIDEWCKNHKGKPIRIHKYKQFLQDIGYLLEQGADFKISTEILMKRFP